MKKIKVKEIVATNIIELFENELVSKALKKITSNRIHNIVVVNSDNSRSILSTTDILKNILKEGWKNAKISSLFRRPLKTISEETSIVQAAISMEEGDEILGELDGSQKLYGVVTHRDISEATEILKWQDEYSEELTAISVNSIIKRNSAITADFQENLYDKLPELNASPTDCLIALKEQKPCGIITKRDIIRLLDSDKNLDVKIEEHMSSPLFTLEGKVSVSSALISMQNRHFRRAIVLDDNGLLAGLVSQKAIISIIYNHAAKRMWHFNENSN
ncbi:MAG: hypothetical protein QG567_738, partial [Campylobacterota bacterium]|nr:hypothetical protein [Campylobacterota bacterium]